MTWLAPVAALVGVIVGGVLNASLNAELHRRAEFAAAAVAARMVRSELALIRDTIAASIKDKRWGAILDPGLPYGRGLWAIEHAEGKRPESAWSVHAGDLARVLAFAEWESIAAPYDAIDRTSLRFWTDDAERDLNQEAAEYLKGVVDRIPAALAALEPVARGLRRTRIQRLVPLGAKE